MILMTEFEILMGLCLLGFIVLLIMVTTVSFAYDKGIRSVTKYEKLKLPVIPRRYEYAEVEVPIVVAEVVGYLSPLTGPVAIIPATPLNDSHDLFADQAVPKQLRNDQ